jgi:hypothetical protein
MLSGLLFKRLMHVLLIYILQSSFDCCLNWMSELIVKCHSCVPSLSSYIIMLTLSYFNFFPKLILSVDLCKLKTYLYLVLFLYAPCHVFMTVWTVTLLITHRSDGDHFRKHLLLLFWQLQYHLDILQHIFTFNKLFHQT